MSFLSNFQLYWYDAHYDTSPDMSSLCGGHSAEEPTNANKSIADDRECSTPSSPRLDQFVFTADVDLPFSMHRVQSVQDLLRAVSGEDNSGEKIAISLIALICGNLVATGQLWSLFALSVVAMIMATLEFKLGTAATLTIMVALFVNSLWTGAVSFHWVLTVAIVIVVALIVMSVVVHLVRQDPRSYVLLLHQLPDTSRFHHVAIRNDCCMDVKLLVFDNADVVRWIPHGGMFGGHLLRRGEVHLVGEEPPYVVKLYAPWEKELGTYVVERGTYSFRATAPPLFISTAKQVFFSNCTESPVSICMCSRNCWTSSLWLPLAPLLARLSWPAVRVAPKEKVPISGPCLLRVFDGLAEQACCVVHRREAVLYYGVVQWTPIISRSSRSSSSLLVNAIR